MAIGVDLNWPPPGDGDEDGMPDLDAAPAGAEDHGPTAPDEEDHAAPAAEDFCPFHVSFVEPAEEHMDADIDIGLDSELPDLNVVVDDLHNYGVYANSIDIDFDIEELSDSDSDSASDDEEHAPQNANQANRRKNTTDRQRQDIYEALLASSNHGKLKKKSTTIVAQQFQVSRRTTVRIWDIAKQCIAEGRPVDVSSKKPKNSGRKRLAIDLARVASIPLHKRTTIRKLAKELGVSKSWLHKQFKEGLLRRHSNSLKPFLKEANKRERLRWSISLLDPTTLPHAPMFIEMNNIIHIDEKWFNATKKNKNFYMLPQEVNPHRTVQNKNSIDKVMVLCAIAMPLHDDAGNEIFNGKVGVWPFVRKEPAQRTSRNRQRGTLVTKSINVVRDTMRSYLISKVLPAIKAKWPREHANRTIWIQQDNARTHVPIDDEQFAIAVAQTGLDIRLINQPPSSPDMNCLDLGFFASLQSLTYDTDCRNMDELIDNVIKKYDEYEPSLLRNVFLTLQSCLIEVMKVRGGNKYPIPHMNKARLQTLGILPTRLSCEVIRRRHSVYASQ